MNDFKIFDERKPRPMPTPDKPIKNGKVRKIRDYSAYKTVRPDKIEEIKAVWHSPKFRDDNSRLVYLFRHCTSPEFGYTAREFATVKFPEKMAEDAGYGMDQYAISLIHQMFIRFRHNFNNHEILLHPMLKKINGDTIYRYYYYNIIYDEEAVREINRRALPSLVWDIRELFKNWKTLLKEKMRYEQERGRNDSKKSRNVRKTIRRRNSNKK